jgi:hypothetical protein
MVIEKYKNDGWGLSKKEFELMYDELKKYSKTEKAHDAYVYNVVEFGSGRSTEFLIDALKEDFHFPMWIKSFDDSKEYAYKGMHQALTLHILPLVDCDDATFAQMFEDKEYDASKMKDKATAVHTRQRNTFYKLDKTMIPYNIDLLIVDGPHGNGRSLAYLHCAKSLRKGALIMIDDASHYPFYEHLSKLVKTEIIYEQHIRDNNKWESGGDFIFCKVV